MESWDKISKKLISENVLTMRIRIQIILSKQIMLWKKHRIRTANPTTIRALPHKHKHIQETNKHKHLNPASEKKTSNLSCLKQIRVLEKKPDRN